MTADQPTARSHRPDTAAAPLILTLELDAVSHNFFDTQRQRHFPADRNHLAAHLTLFHALPDLIRDDVEDALAREAASCTGLALHVTGLHSLGRGVAYRLESPDLSSLRNRLAERFVSHLTPQDAQSFRPHVTVQNKVTVEEARATLALLGANFSRFDCTGTALSLWRYDGGPWLPLRRFAFDPARD